MNAQHTPGDWSVSELDATGEVSADYIFIEPGVAVIERSVAGSDQFDMPDAILLAAAKDLLEALTFAVRFWDQLTPSDAARLRKVLDKATGAAS